MQIAKIGKSNLQVNFAIDKFYMFYSNINKSIMNTSKHDRKSSKKYKKEV